jgi:hypothetical protein
MLSTGLGPAFLCLRIAAGPTRASNRPSPLAFSPEPAGSPAVLADMRDPRVSHRDLPLRVLVSLRERTHRSAPVPPYPLVSFPLRPRQLAQPPSRLAPPVPSSQHARRGARPGRPAGAHAKAGVGARTQERPGKSRKTPLPSSPWHPRRAACCRGRHLARDVGGPGAAWTFPPRDSAALVQKEGREQWPRNHPHWGFAPVPEPPPGEGRRRRSRGRGGEVGVRARRAGALLRRRNVFVRRRSCARREAPFVSERKPDRSTPWTSTSRRRTAKSATPSPSTHGEHRGRLALFFAPVALALLPVGEPSSRLCLCTRAAASPWVTSRRAVSRCVAAAWGQGCLKPCWPRAVVVSVVFLGGCRWSGWTEEGRRAAATPSRRASPPLEHAVAVRGAVERFGLQAMFGCAGNVRAGLRAKPLRRSGNAAVPPLGAPWIPGVRAGRAGVGVNRELRSVNCEPDFDPRLCAGGKSGHHLAASPWRACDGGVETGHRDDAPSATCGHEIRIGPASTPQCQG